VAGNETRPKAGDICIFFVQQLTALKLLPATDENVAMVKKLIAEQPKI
jgi:hypothetical protein